MRAWPFLLVAACSFSPATSAVQAGGDGGTKDASMPDAPHVWMDAPPAANLCFGAQPYYFCLDPLPTQAITLPSTIKTDTDQCIGGTIATLGTNQQVCVYAGTTVTINATNVSGKLPLVIASLGDIAVNGLLDVSSRNRKGPNANSMYCTYTNVNGQASNNGGGGGAGGSFASAGGAGGAGGGGAAGASTGAAGTSVLRGGCHGGDGGDGNQGRGGNGGDGGGAVYLVARGTITVSSTIDASGQLGRGGELGQNGNNAGAGAGGGGSGGMILFHAMRLTVPGGGRLVANGASGGGGGSPGGNGVDGRNPDPTMPSVAPRGGNGNPNGSNGGDGAVGTSTGHDSSTAGDSGGGGGGGGGVGMIKVLAGGVPGPNANISPPAQP